MDINNFNSNKVSILQLHSNRNVECGAVLLADPNCLERRHKSDNYRERYIRGLKWVPHWCIHPVLLSELTQWKSAATSHYSS